MKATTYALTLLLLITTSVFGQTKRVPANLKQALLLLDADCPDSLKRIIKITGNKDLENLVYPGDGDYKTIYNWISDENEDSRLVHYLNSKGIRRHQSEVILIAFKEFLNGSNVPENDIYRPFQEIETKWANEDKIRYTADSLRGIYIPMNLEDCFNQINTFWPDSTKLKMKTWTEPEFSARLHHGFGTWLRNNWQLWGGSRLSTYFNDLGIFHPDDMSGIILHSYYRNRNGMDIKLEEQIQYYKEYWEHVKAAEMQQKQDEFSEYKVGDTIRYKYHLGYVSSNQEKKADDDICTATGLIKELNQKELTIKVRLIRSCDRRGIIRYDNKNHLILNKDTRQWEKPHKRIIKRMSVKQEHWFGYNDWETNE